MMGRNPPIKSEDDKRCEMRFKIKVKVVSPQEGKTHLTVDVPFIKEQMPVWLKVEAGILFFRATVYVKLV